jgi:hypothetical protein
MDDEKMKQKLITKTKPKPNGYLLEYESLRSEIMKRQQARELILGVTMAALGVILGQLFSNQNVTNCSIQDIERSFILLCVGFLFIFGAVIFTVHHTQQMDVISGFIRTYIEPNVEGILWESKWTLLRQSDTNKLLKSKLPLGTSKYFAGYYLILTVSLVLIAVLLNIFCKLWMASLISIFAGGCICAEYYLHSRRFLWFKKWKPFWDELAQLEKKN